MRPGFQLNLHDRTQNTLFESHDPSMMFDPVSQKYYSYCTDAAITSSYQQGIPVRMSQDLVHFQFMGYALSKKAVTEGSDNGEFPRTPGFWAPFVEYVNGEYRMYYSATKAFGSSESRIWLAVAKDPLGPFENRGVVVDTWFTGDDLPNGIDPHIVDDPGQQRKYLVYGSFFGGIYIKELDVATGLSKDGDCRNLGIQIAHKPKASAIDGPEGAAVIYQPEEKSYYLFLSYGWLGDDYDIRVGKSESVSGSYLDKQGRNLNGESLGTKLAGSYFFSSANPFAMEVAEDNGKISLAEWKFAGFRGPGHGVPFYDPQSDGYFFVHHVRDGADCLRAPQKDALNRDTYTMHYMVVRRMLFLGGWPVFSPEPFAGEKLCEQDIFHLAWQHGNLSQSSIEQLHASGLEIEEDHQVEWILFSNESNEMVNAVTGFEALEADVFAAKAYDFENSAECMVFMGYTQDDRTIWGKLQPRQQNV